MTPADLLTQVGAPGALVFALAYVTVQVLKGRAEKSSPVTDASTANAVLLASLESEREEGDRLRDRLSAAEHRIDQLQTALETERETHRLELSRMRTQLDELGRRLAIAESRYEKEETP